MARVIAAAAVLAALLVTAPASAESVCVHKDNCQSLPGPNIVGGGLTDHFTLKLRLFGAEVVHATGLRFESPAPIFEGAPTNDARVLLCVNGACSGQFGYTFWGDPDFGTYIRLYTNGTCTQFAENASYSPETCIYP
jgi:hypothetical protein